MRGPRGPKGPYQDTLVHDEAELQPEGDGYDALPGCIKSVVTKKDYTWMGDYARSRLIEDMTQPQGVED